MKLNDLECSLKSFLVLNNASYYHAIQDEEHLLDYQTCHFPYLSSIMIYSKTYDHVSIIVVGCQPDAFH